MTPGARPVQLSSAAVLVSTNASRSYQVAGRRRPRGHGPHDREHDQHAIRCAAARHIPLWLKLAYTAFMAVLVPVYLRNYGPTNFLYFCDLALIITLVGVWIESPLLVSICAVGVIASQTLWVIGFLSNPIDHPLTGLTQSEHPHGLSDRDFDEMFTTDRPVIFVFSWLSNLDPSSDLSAAHFTEFAKGYWCRGCIVNAAAGPARMCG